MKEMSVMVGNQICWMVCPEATAPKGGGPNATYQREKRLSEGNPKACISPTSRLTKFYITTRGQLESILQGPQALIHTFLYIFLVLAKHTEALKDIHIKGSHTLNYIVEQCAGAPTHEACAPPVSKHTKTPSLRVMRRTHTHPPLLKK